VIGHQVPFVDRALLLLRELAKHLVQVPAQLTI